jgi:polar amino acid transport system substrate-binding protein
MRTSASWANPFRSAAGVGMGLREGDPLRDQFDAAIGEMKADGSLNDLLRKWFGEDTQVYE